VEHHHQIANLLSDFLDNRQFLCGDRWVRSDHDDCGVDVRDKRLRGCRVSGEDGTEARCIHEAHSVREKRARNEHFYSRDALRVLRVVLFRDILSQFFRGDFHPFTSVEANSCASKTSIPDYGWYRCDRQDARR
jgi:hypothetical protein